MATKRFEFQLSDRVRAALAATARTTGEPISAIVRRGIAMVQALDYQTEPNYRRDLQAFVLEMRADPALSGSAAAVLSALDALDLEADGNPAAAALLDALALIAAAPWPLAFRLSVFNALTNYDGPLHLPRRLMTGSQTEPQETTP